MPITNYYSVNGRLIGEKVGANARIDYLPDALGNVVGTMNQSSQLVNTYRFKPYGGLLAKTGAGADPSFRWVGQQGYRQTGKKYSDVYVRARHYDERGGRWTNHDPASYDGLFHYIYAASSPTSLSDPSGQSPADPTGMQFGSAPPCDQKCYEGIFRPRPPFARCPNDKEYKDIQKICIYDQAIAAGQNPPSMPGFPQATTSICCTFSCAFVSFRTGCTMFYPEFDRLPLAYQICIWDHELRRRALCYVEGNSGPYQDPDEARRILSCVCGLLRRCRRPCGTCEPRFGYVPPQTPRD